MADLNPTVFPNGVDADTNIIKSGVKVGSFSEIGDLNESITEANNAASAAIYTLGSANQALSGVTSDANAAKVMITAALNGTPPLTYKGYWDANTNSPALSSGNGSEGDLYIVSIDGKTSLDGNASWNIGDGAWFTSGKWVYFERARWPAIARTITALTRVNIGGTGSGIGAHDGGWRWALVDEQGFIGGGLDADDNYRFASTIADIGPVRILSGDETDGLLVTDAQGFVGFDSSGKFSPKKYGFLESELDAFDRTNRDYTATVWRSGFQTGQRPVCDFNGVLSTGQSEQNGEMSLPLLQSTLSSTAVGALMVGGSARCTDPNPTNTAWEPVGGSYQLQPLADLAWNWQTNTAIVRDAALLNTATLSSVTISDNGLTITSNDPSVDFTKCFLVNDKVQFSGFSGAAAWMNLFGTGIGNIRDFSGNPSQSFGGTSYTSLRGVTANTLTLWVPAQAGTYNNVTIALYAPVDPSLGQDQTVGSTLYEAALSLDRPSDRKYVCGNACIGGQTLAQLSKGATPDIFSRVGQWAQALVTSAKSQNADASVCVHVISFGQGGSDTSTDYATYKAQLIQYVADARAAIKSATGQFLDPFFEAFVISGGNEPQTDSMGVVRAQMDAICSGQISNAYIVGPGYFVPDYYAHWSSNGERWFGALRAKVRHWVMRGAGWQPMRMLNARYRDNQIVVNIHVPFAPLQARDCFVGQTYQTFDDYGFSVFDSSGTQMTITNVDLGPTYVVITVAGLLGSAPRVTYAEWSNVHYGSGNICDSDPAVSFDNYTFDAASGQPFTENVPDLVGKPYPLNNWLCPGSLIAESI